MPQASVLGPPPVQITPAELDLGTVRPNQRFSGTIYIQNLSDKWLKILSAKPDCTCTNVSLGSNTLAPGQNVPLEVEYRSNLAMGAKRGFIKLLIDGYDAMDIAVTSFVTMPVRAEPPFIDVRQMAQGKASGEIFVLSNDERPFRILAVSGAPPAYVDFDATRDEPRNSYRLKYDFSNHDPVSGLDRAGRKLPGWVTVETDHPDCPVFDVEVRHRSTMRVFPGPTATWVLQEKRVMLGGIEPGQSAEFEVVAKKLPRAQAIEEIRAAITDSDQFTAEVLSVQPGEDGLLVRVRVTPAPTHRGLIYGTLYLHSENQGEPVVIIAKALSNVETSKR